MKSFCLLIVQLLLFAACSRQPRNQESFPKHDTVSAPIVASTGWKSLFDGKTLNDWRIFKNRPNNTWEVKDGALHCRPVVEGVKGADERSDLISTETYGNFELVFDFKFASETNSGVMFRVSEELDQPYHTGPEYQILDDMGYPGKVTEMQLTGATFGLYATTGTKKLHPAGEWNNGKIVANGKHIEHWLNGDKILEYEIGSPDWTKRRDASKWKEFPRFSLEDNGHIDLQDHGSEIWFRNILIRSL